MKIAGAWSINAEQFGNQRVLVTGASGFIGSALCHRLSAAGLEVHATSRSQKSQGDERVHWWAADLADPSAASRVVVRVMPDVIFHLSGHVYGSRDLDMVVPTFQANLATTVNLMAAAVQMGCKRFVLAGSIEEPNPGDATPAPSSPYAAAKWAASGYARMFHRLYGLPVVILRISQVYGPGQSDSRKLIPYVVSSLLRGEEPRLSSGRRKIDWVYVGDVVDALVASGHTQGIEGLTIHVGSGTPVSIQDLVAELVRLTGSSIRPVFGALQDRAMEQERIADVEPAFTLLGWRPRTSLENGLRETISWYTREFSHSKSE